MSETRLRERIVRHGESLFARGYGCGASGNISVLLDDGFLVTPTNSCLGRLDPARIARLGPDGTHLSGDPPSKEAFLHQAMYGARADARAIVHLHSTCSVAVSILADVDPADVLPPLTAYYVMRVGRLPLIPYFRPGDRALAEAVADFAADHPSCGAAGQSRPRGGRQGAGCGGLCGGRAGGNGQAAPAVARRAGAAAYRRSGRGTEGGVPHLSRGTACHALPAARNEGAGMSANL